MRSTQPLPSRSAAGSKAASPLHVPCAPTIMPWSSASTAPSALTSTSLVSSAVPRSSSSAPAVSERAPSPSAALRTTSAAHRLKRRASRPSPGERSSPGWRRAPTHPRDRALFALLARSPNQIARHAPLLGEGCMGRLLFGPRRVACCRTCLSLRSGSASGWEPPLDATAITLARARFRRATGMARAALMSGWGRSAPLSPAPRDRSAPRWRARAPKSSGSRAGAGGRAE